MSAEIFWKIMKQLFLFLILLAAFYAGAAAQDKRIEEIRRIYKETNERIAEAGKNFEESEIFLTEIHVNKSETPYPAIGIFKENISFYYTFGDREKNPYPNRLLKIVTVTTRSAQVEYSELLFNAAGQLIFYFAKPEMESADRNGERRLYFAGGKPIRYQVGDKVIDVNGAAAKEDLRLVSEKQKRLMHIFINSLE
jgi:hypothetical protein